MNIKKKCKPLSITLIIIGIFIIIIQPISSNITGAVIDISTAISRVWFFIGLGLVIVGAVSLGWFDSGLEKHASERMQERKVFPSVIGAAFSQGKHYRLKGAQNYGEAKGATDAYVLRNAADIVPGGKIGGRILKVGGPRKWKNVIVLAQGKKVKTTFVRSDSELNSFLRKYT